MTEEKRFDFELILDRLIGLGLILSLWFGVVTLFFAMIYVFRLAIGG